MSHYNVRYVPTWQLELREEYAADASRLNAANVAAHTQILYDQMTDEDRDEFLTGLLRLTHRQDWNNLEMCPGCLRRLTVEILPGNPTQTTCPDCNLLMEFFRPVDCSGVFTFPLF